MMRNLIASWRAGEVPAEKVADAILAQQGHSRKERRELLAATKAMPRDPVEWAGHDTKDTETMDKAQAQVFEQLKANIEDFKSRHTGAIDATEARMDELEKLIGRGGLGGPGGGQPREVMEAKAQLWDFVKTGKAPDVQAGMMVGDEPSGGYLVQPILDPVIGRYLAEMSPMRRLARVVTVRTGDAFEVPFSEGGAGAAWVGETDARAESDAPSLAKIRIPLREATAMPQVTQRLLDDSSYDVDTFLREELAEAFADLEASAFISGDGVASPRGLLTYDKATTTDATRPLGTIQYIASGAAGGFPDASGIAGAKDADALADCVYALGARYRRAATWLMNSNTAALVRKLRDADGRWLWTEGLAAGEPARLLGYPVEIAEDMPDPASDAFSIAFGDWSRAYCIAARAGLRLLRDPFTAKPYVRFYTTMRVGGGLVDSRAVKLIKMATS